MPDTRRKVTTAMRWEPETLAELDEAVSRRRDEGRPLANRTAFVDAAVRRALEGERR